MTKNVFDDPRITAVGLLVEAHAGLSTRFATQYEENGLSAVEFEVLTRLARSPGNQLRMTDLAAQTSLSTSGVTRVVDRMERDGLLCRRACPSDRRSSYAVVTRSGLDRLNETLPGHLKIIEQWFTGQLEPQELEALLHALRKVRDAVHPGAIAGSQAADTGDEETADSEHSVVRSGRRR
ncbi:MarR family transcriptional regulator [Micromonospora echinospora]|uniref:DNA-binding transcriptional regulator, MarR family n=1 Tax=Micromonospora echinospora TaxID=1877 RepID=A0A1C4W7N6_MICEC|nr:MarR family transcriptional regulator [Micromonospora echinospora]OZV80011.1 MarR family transcriptional regulator [Micromonospora echinospora]SCE92220.1 DNA-binding transcriptional regulator, MarR family [Micromonospora echinospora]